MLSVRNLTVLANKSPILDDINFEVVRGDVLAVIGPNGAGKTTLFRALLGMQDFEGEISWKADIRIGYVPQRMEIETDIPLTVLEFLRLRGSENFSRGKAEEADRRGGGRAARGRAGSP